MQARVSPSSILAPAQRLLCPPGVDEIAQMRGAFVGGAVHEFAADGRVVGHPRHAEPAGLAVHLDLESGIVAELRILTLLHIVEDALQVLVPLAGLPGVLLQLVGIERRPEIDVELEPGAFRAGARHLFRIVGAELEDRAFPARRRPLHRVLERGLGRRLRHTVLRIKRGDEPDGRGDQSGDGEKTVRPVHDEILPWQGPPGVCRRDGR